MPVLFNAEVALLLNKQKKNYQEKGIRVPEYVYIAPRRVCRLLLETVDLRIHMYRHAKITRAPSSRRLTVRPAHPHVNTTHPTQDADADAGVL